MQMPSKATIENVYGDKAGTEARFENLSTQFTKNFGMTDMEFFTAPGRTEIVGNHTDHNGGKVLAASIDMDTIGAAYPNNSNVIEIISEGYPGKIVVDLDKIDEVPINQGTVSLVAGMVKGAEKFGYKVSGFSAYVSTEVISSAGVSSSASFEMLFCTIMNYFFNDNKIPYMDYARIGQFSENQYWSKASGLMDQMACAVGGTILLDFQDGVKYEKVDFGYDKFGYEMVIINTGKGHADLSDEYSAVPNEMKAVAKCLGCTQLADTSMEALLENLSKVEAEVKNDRAILRAFHFLNENARVEDLITAMNAKDSDKILHIISESGRSSWELLQNCYSLIDYKEQKISLALALTEQFLNKIGDGCCRVHGGGFAGVIMCAVPKQYTEEYVAFISKYFGIENVYPMNIRQVGATHLAK